MQLIPINVEVPPVRTTHICYYVRYDELHRQYNLFEVIEARYLYADDNIEYPIIETHKRATVTKADSTEFAAMYFMQQAQELVRGGYKSYD